MKKLRNIRAAAGALAVAAALPCFAAAQQASPAPLELLLENRAVLQLTEEQVARVQAIRDSLTLRNEPLIGRVVELRAEFRQAQRAGARRQGGLLQRVPLAGRQTRQAEPSARLEEIRSSAQALLNEIQANNRGAMQQVNQLLTPIQRRRLREMIQQRRPAAATPPAADTARSAPQGPLGL